MWSLHSACKWEDWAPAPGNLTAYITAKSLLLFKVGCFLGKFNFSLKGRKQDIRKEKEKNLSSLSSLQSKLNSLGKYQHYHFVFLPFLQQKLHLPNFSLHILLYRRHGSEHETDQNFIWIGPTDKIPSRNWKKAWHLLLLTIVQGRCIYAYIHIHMCSTAWVPASSCIPRTERGRSVLGESILSLKSDQERVFEVNMGGLQITCPIQTWPSWWKAHWLCDTAHSAQSCRQATSQARTNSRLFFPPV